MVEAWSNVQGILTTPEILEAELRQQPAITVDERVFGLGLWLFRRYGRFCTLHSLGQTLLQWVGAPRARDTQSPPAACLWDLKKVGKQ